MRLLKVFLFFIFYFLFFIFLLPSFVKAEDCADTDDPEFHSLRPYPAEPCNPKKENLSYICGNDMVLTDTITVSWTEGLCVESGGPSGTLTCQFDLERGFTVEVDPSQSELPIMGNTEDVTPNADPDMPDVQKVTEYVSWYLNGVINRAEYAFLKWNDPDDIKKLVNLSGPIRKLLPQRIQDNISVVAITGLLEAAATREKQVEDAGSVRHNQIVGCTWGLNIPLGQILALPGPCKITNNPILSLLLDLTVRKEHRLKEWKDQIPPKREDFPEYKDYYIAYKEWRGKECKRFPIGVFEIVWCYNDPGKPDYYSNLYPYIPFSSTEDRVGDLEVIKPVKTGGDVEVIDPIFDICIDGTGCIPGNPYHGSWDLDKSANNTALHFAHMQENLELSSLLQSTFVPQSGTDQNLGYTEPPQIGPGCKILDVRSNPGDKLDPYPYPKDEKEVSLGRFSYRAQFTCIFSYYYDVFGIRHISPPTCTKTVVFTSKINVGSPLANEIWAQTVAGNSAIFKMIFPKLNVVGSLGAIKDIPGVTPIGYDSNPYKAAAADVDPKNPEVYFPHIGGISEYFLKGIQTMLRPKGYGETISFGKTTDGGGDKCDQDVPDSSVPAKYLGAFKSNFIDLADRWSAKCPGPDNNLAEECYNYVVTESATKGLNPAFVLTIWLNESDASNYCDGGDTTQDFGVNLPSLYKNLVGQLNKFSEFPDAFRYCTSVPGFIEPMHAFLSRFQSSSGSCNPLDPVATQYYKGVRDQTWSWVSGCTANERFNISWPTDNSCP